MDDHTWDDDENLARLHAIEEADDAALVPCPRCTPATAGRCELCFGYAAVPADVARAHARWEAREAHRAACLAALDAAETWSGVEVPF